MMTKETPEEHVEFLMKHYKKNKLEARNLIESQIESLDAKMDKQGYTPSDLEEMRYFKKVRELLIKFQP